MSFSLLFILLILTSLFSKTSCCKLKVDYTVYRTCLDQRTYIFFWWWRQIECVCTVIFMDDSSKNFPGLENKKKTLCIHWQWPELQLDLSRSVCFNPKVPKLFISTIYFLNKWCILLKYMSIEKCCIFNSNLSGGRTQIYISLRELCFLAQFWKGFLI